MRQPWKVCVKIEATRVVSSEAALTFGTTTATIGTVLVQVQGLHRVCMCDVCYVHNLEAHRSVTLQECLVATMTASVAGSGN